MGGSSKSKDNSARDRQRTQEDLDRNWSKRTSDDDVMGLWQQMSASQMGQAVPLLDAMMRAGTSQMNANPYGPQQQMPDLLGMVQHMMGGGGQSPSIINQPQQQSPSNVTGGPVNTDFNAGWSPVYLPPINGQQPQTGQVLGGLGGGFPPPRGKHTFFGGNK